jgi:hypothetical protein
VSDIEKLSFNELQEKILTSDITNNPLMTSSKIDTKNKTLPTKCKGLVQSVNETYKKVQQLEKYETDFATFQNSIVGDAFNDPSMLEKLKSVAPTVIDGLVNLRDEIDSILQFVLDDYEDVFTVTEPVTEFTLTNVPIGKIRMYVNGVRQFRTCFKYNKTRNSISWVFTAENGGFDIEDSEVVFEYDYNREEP